ncbi:PspC domain-containing protein, partial [Kineococcus sp. R8]|uniref:PspC domain-containing protein n=1 Tax=Kineococcus siccus TaxID=2696567 RepID=UPI0014131014
MDTTETGAGAAPSPDAAPSPGAAPTATPGAVERFFATVRGWGVERGEDRWFAGVCGGTARRLGIDAVVVRGVLIALTVVGGLGLALYGVAWALLPDTRGRIEAEAAVRGDVSGSAAAAAGLVVVDLVVGRGVVGAGLGWWQSGPGFGVLVTLLVAALGWWLVRDLRRGDGGSRACGTTPPAPAPPAPDGRGPVP